MNKELASFILHWRWYFRKEGNNRKRTRTLVADKWCKSPKKIELNWTADDFCATWVELEIMGYMK